MYNKLFTKILDSSIWLAPDPHRLVWITLIAAMDEDGNAMFASAGNLAARARVSREQAEDAVRAFEAPDPDSGDPDNDGRRIERFPGGWHVLNSHKYREMVTKAVIRAQTKARTARWRESQRGDASVTLGDASVTLSDETVTPSRALSEARAEAFLTQATPESERSGDLSPESAAEPGRAKPYRVPNCPHRRIVDLYHELLPTAPRVIVDDETRAGYMQARWRYICAEGKLTTEQGLEVFESFFRAVSASKFLTGQVVSRDRKPFKVSLGWLMRPTNFTKVVEGHYRS